MVIQARHYQAGSIESAFKLWDSGVRSVLVQVPTGGGKTYIGAECARRWYERGKRSLFAVHLREIVRQAKDEMAEMTGLPVGMELASEKSSTVWPEPIICASIQTLNGRGRLQKFYHEQFGLIIIDEAHHGVSKTWQNVLDYFPDAKVLCLTATPERSDKKKLGKIVDAIAYEYSLKQACDDGWLAKPRQLTIEIPGLDFRKIPRKQGELAKEELERIMIKYATACAHRSVEAIFDLFPHELDDVPELEWNTYIGDRQPKKTLIFCVTRLHADKVRNALNSFREGLCGYVDGETPHIERRDTFRNFKTGSLACLANCSVTTEGYDNPYIKLILDMAPTMSHGRALQKWGRGTRTLPGTLDNKVTPEERLTAISESNKPYCTVVDFTDNSRDHRLVTLIDIFGPDQPDSVKREVEKRMKDKATDVETEIELVLKERYELRKTHFNETEIDGFTGKKKKKKLTKAQKEQRRLALNAKGLSQKEFDILERNKLSPATRSLEENRDLLRKITHRRLAGLCTYAQGFKLKAKGYSPEVIREMRASDASLILQSDVLMKYGYSEQQCIAMTKDQRSDAIDAIARNGWKPIHQQQQAAF